MKTPVLFALIVAAAAAASAQASSPTITWEPIPEDSGFVPRSAFSSVFSAMSGPYAAFPAATGSLGFDDYQSTYADGDSFALQSMRFVGGVTTVGGIMTFDFFDADDNLVSTTSLGLPSAGNFIWTITFESAPGLKDSDFFVPASGYLQLSADALTTGQWFLSTSLPTVGTESREPGEGSLTAQSHRFELNVPTPGALALLGMGGIAALRRRR